MKKINIEIKAKCEEPNRIRKILEKDNARFEGLDHQIDTYFKTEEGRLKLRQGRIENFLVSYNRINQKGPKRSIVKLYKTNEDSESLKDILTQHYGIKCIVNKQREIYYIDNIKFHIDTVAELGNFVEIEACSDNPKDEDKLRNQTEEYMKKFEINEEDLIDKSYSDLILEK